VSELKVDFDRDTLPRDFRDRLAMVARVFGFRVEYVGYERTARGWHVRVGVRRRVAMATAVALQAILGSDWKRELFNSRRAVAWRNVPAFWRERANVLYERHYHF
jgi:hypothetical protein